MKVGCPLATKGAHKKVRAALRAGEPHTHAQSHGHSDGPWTVPLPTKGLAGFHFRGGGGSIEPSGRTPPPKGLN